MGNERTFPVIEIFGPTIQGEGALAGVPTLFVRLGGCDYRCVWCDSMHAVDPKQVRENSEQMTATQIVRQLAKIRAGGIWVTISGGNPALFELDSLIFYLQGSNFRVSIETQGSKWQPWMNRCDLVTISPKPPSSRQKTNYEVLDQVVATHRPALKVVVFDQADYEYAQKIHERYPHVEFYLSVGTEQGWSDEHTKEAILRRLKWLSETAANDPKMADTRVLPQLHVLTWGTMHGV